MFIPGYSDNPALMHLFIRALELQVMVGAYAHEYDAPQRVLVDCDVWVTQQGDGDSLDNAFNYDRLVEAALAAFQTGHVVLQETAAKRIAETLLTDPVVRCVRVQTTKPDAYDTVEAAGVELWRFAP